MLDDLFVPDPPAGDSSNRIADTRFVNNAVSSATATGTITNTMLAQMASYTIKSNVTNAAASPGDNSISSVIDNMVGSTQGAILYRNAATWVALPPGTAGSALVTNGAGANPSWSPPGSIILLNTLQANGVVSTVDTTSFTSAYSAYDLVLDSLRVSTTGNWMYFQVHSGGSFQTTSYTSGGAFNRGGGALTVQSGSTGAISLTVPSSSLDTVNGMGTGSIGLSGKISVVNPTVGSAAMVLCNVGYAASSAATVWINNVGIWNSSGAIDGFAVAVGTGTMTGTIKVYGIT